MSKYDLNEVPSGRTGQKYAVEHKAPNPRFNENDHPRDREGKFIETGAIVKIWGGSSGHVIGNVGGGRIEVQKDDGSHVIVHRNYLTVTARPDGSAPTDKRDASPAPLAVTAPAVPDASVLDAPPVSLAPAAQVRDKGAELADAVGKQVNNPKLATEIRARTTAYQAAVANGVPDDEADERAALLATLDAVTAQAGTDRGIADLVASVRTSATAEPDAPGSATGAQPDGAAAHLRTPDGTSEAWLRTDEGDTPVGYMRDNTTTPPRTVRYTDAEQWAAAVDSRGMAPVDNATPPAPDQAPAAPATPTPDTTTPGAPGAADGPPAASAPPVNEPAAAAPASAPDAPAAPAADTTTPDTPAPADKPPAADVPTAPATDPKPTPAPDAPAAPETPAPAPDKPADTAPPAPPAAPAPAAEPAPQPDAAPAAPAATAPVATPEAPAAPAATAPDGPTKIEDLGPLPTQAYRTTEEATQAGYVFGGDTADLAVGEEIVGYSRGRYRTARVAKIGRTNATVEYTTPGAINDSLNWVLYARSADPEAWRKTRYEQELRNWDYYERAATPGTTGTFPNGKTYDYGESTRQQARTFLEKNPDREAYATAQGQGEYDRVAANQAKARAMTPQDIIDNAHMTTKIVKLAEIGRKPAKDRAPIVPPPPDPAPPTGLPDPTASIENLRAYYASGEVGDTPKATAFLVGMSSEPSLTLSSSGDIAMYKMDARTWVLMDTRTGLSLGPVMSEWGGKAQAANLMDKIHDGLPGFDWTAARSSSAEWRSPDDRSAGATMFKIKGEHDIAGGKDTLAARDYREQYGVTIKPEPAPTPDPSPTPPPPPSPQPDPAPGPVDPDKQYQEHVAEIETKIGAALAAGNSTDAKFTLDADRQIWAPDRAAQHKAIVDELYTAAQGVPNDGKALIAGGLGGAGKSTVLNKHAGVDTSQYLTINPDDIKVILAERGLVPVIDGLSPMETTPLAHEEASHIAQLLAARAYADRKNVIWDITMSRASSVQGRIKNLRDNGYTDIQAVFVDIPVEVSVQRALARHRRGMDAYKAGKGLGGRYVPPSVIRENASADWSSANRGVFEELRGQFDGWQVYDNSVEGRAPQFVDSSDSHQQPVEPGPGTELAGRFTAPPDNTLPVHAPDAVVPGSGSDPVSVYQDGTPLVMYTGDGVPIRVTATGVRNDPVTGWGQVVQHGDGSYDTYSPGIMATEAEFAAAWHVYDGQGKIVAGGPGVAEGQAGKISATFNRSGYFGDKRRGPFRVAQGDGQAAPDSEVTFADSAAGDLVEGDRVDVNGTVVSVVSMNRQGNDLSVEYVTDDGQRGTMIVDKTEVLRKVSNGGVKDESEPVVAPVSEATRERQVHGSDLVAGDRVWLGNRTAVVSKVEPGSDPDILAVTFKWPDRTSITTPLGRDAILDRADHQFLPDPSPLDNTVAKSRPVLYTYQRRNLVALGWDLHDDPMVAEAARRVRTRQPLAAEHSRAMAAALLAEANQPGVKAQRQRSMIRLAGSLNAASIEAGGNGIDLPAIPGSDRATRTGLADFTPGDQLAFVGADGKAVSGKLTNSRRMMGGRLFEVTYTDAQGNDQTVLLTKNTQAYLLPDLPGPEPVKKPDGPREHVEMNRIKVGDTVHIPGDNRTAAGDFEVLEATTTDSGEPTFRVKRQREYGDPGADQFWVQNITGAPTVVRVSRGPESAGQPRDADMTDENPTPIAYNEATVGDRVTVDQKFGAPYTGLVVATAPTAVQDADGKTVQGRILKIRLDEGRTQTVSVFENSPNQITRLVESDTNAVERIEQAKKRREDRNRAYQIAGAFEQAFFSVSGSFSHELSGKINHGNYSEGVFDDLVKNSVLRARLEMAAGLDDLTDRLIYGMIGEGRNSPRYAALKPVVLPFAQSAMDDYAERLGETIRNVGPTSPGQTKFQSALTMLDSINSGEVEVEGRDIKAVSRNLVEARKRLDGETSTAALTEVPQLPEGADLKTRIGAYKAALPDTFGTTRAVTRSFGSLDLSALERGEAPEVVEKTLDVRDLAADSGPGEDTMRQLDVVRAAGRDMDGRLAQMMQASNPDLPADHDQALRDLKTQSKALVDRYNAAHGEWRKQRLASPQPPNLAEIKQHADDIYAEYQTVRNQVADLKKLIAEARAVAAKRLLAQVRGVGGVQITYTNKSGTRKGSPIGERSELVKAMRYAESVYPTDWLDRAKARGSIALGKITRGHYSSYKRLINLSESRPPVGDMPNMADVATHELGHEMEVAIPGLYSAQQALLWARSSTGDIGSRALQRTQTLDNLPVYGDEFPEKYSAKVYAGQHLEVFTTAVESLMAGSDYLDDDMRQWVLGVLALL